MSSDPTVTATTSTAAFSHSPEPIAFEPRSADRAVASPPSAFTGDVARPRPPTLAEDVGAGVRQGASGIAEVGYVVADLVQMAHAVAHHQRTGEVKEVEWASAFARQIEAGKPAWRVGLVFATSLPTGGASQLVDNVSTVFEHRMSPDQARSFLVRGAAAQATTTALAVGLSAANGTGWGGRSGPAHVPQLSELPIDSYLPGPPPRD
jgi:hypothetical protein